MSEEKPKPGLEIYEYTEIPSLEDALDFIDSYSKDSVPGVFLRCCRVVAAAYRAEKAQAEKAIEDAANYEMDKHKAETERDRLKAECERMREALQEVANCKTTRLDCSKNAVDLAYDDCAKIAIEALAPPKEGGK